jgi:hypothetical protein
MLGELSGGVGIPSGEVVSNVMSWSRNCPKKVVPAVWVGLLGLLTLSAGSMISSTGPAARLSLASSMPPGWPMSASAARRRSSAGMNGGRSGNIRPNRSAGAWIGPFWWSA